MTTNDETTETMFIETFALIGDLMTQSQRNLSWTQDQLHKGALEDVVKLATALTRIAWILEEATVIDRKTQQRLDDVHQIWLSEDMLDHALRMLERVDGVDRGAMQR